MTEFREIATDALRFWERGRILYNVVLAAVTLVILRRHLSDLSVLLPMAVPLFGLAVIANVLYCAAYVVDGFVQLSEFRAPWRRHRWILLALGTIFAVVLELGVFVLLQAWRAGLIS